MLRQRGRESDVTVSAQVDHATFGLASEVLTARAMSVAEVIGDELHLARTGTHSDLFD
jgi:hypothetical protein